MVRVMKAKKFDSDFDQGKDVTKVLGHSSLHNKGVACGTIAAVIFQLAGTSSAAARLARLIGGKDSGWKHTSLNG